MKFNIYRGMFTFAAEIVFGIYNFIPLLENITVLGMNIVKCLNGFWKSPMNGTVEQGTLPQFPLLNLFIWRALYFG